MTVKLELEGAQVKLCSDGRVLQALRLWSSGSACCVSRTCNAVEHLLQASKAVGVSAGQQNLTEWLKGVMRSYEPGGIILVCHPFLIQSVRLFVSVVECVSGACNVEDGERDICHCTTRWRRANISRSLVCDSVWVEVLGGFSVDLSESTLLLN